MSKAVELKDGPTQCSPEGWCAGLVTMAQRTGGGSTAIGLVEPFVVRLGGGPVTPRMFYRRDRTTHLMLLNFCPWCGKWIDFGGKKP